MKNLEIEVDTEKLISWLLEGDVSIQYQTHRDLLDTDRPDLQARIMAEGWGAAFLAAQEPEGHWGQAFYQPKWTSSHYSLLDIRNLSPVQDHLIIQKAIKKITLEVKQRKAISGLNPFYGDACIFGMFLNYAAYFKTGEKLLRSVVDFLIENLMKDGGFNCRLNRSGAVHSSMHTTLSVLEGITEYEINGYTYRLKELQQAKTSSIEFLLLHQLFLSDRTGKIIHKDFLRLAYPRRWKYDILSALDCFRHASAKWDDRMQAAVDVLLQKRNKDGTWNVQAKHPGKLHFEMEKAGKPSRWNTLRALRVLKHFDVSVIASSAVGEM